MKYDLSDLCLSNSPITYGIVQPGKEGDIKLIRSTDISERYINLKQLRTVSLEVSNKYKRTLLQGNELLISLVGNPGKISLSNRETIGCNIARQVALVRLDPTLVNRMYLYYYLQIGDGKAELASKIMGSVQSVINLKDLKKVKIDLHSLEKQKAIANILSSLDDKIELNNKINKNLEELAQTLYKRWFVDFEFPNEDGEPYKTSGGEMVESEFGLIPKGWEFLELNKVIRNQRDKARSSIFPVLSAVKEGKLVLSSEFFTKDVPSKDLSKYLIVEKGMFSYNPARINIGSIGLNEFNFTGCVSPVYVVLKVETPYVGFFSEYFKTQQFRDQVVLRASGSVRQTLSYEDFGRIKIVYPPVKVINHFNEVFINIDQNIKLYEKQNKKLSDIRDELLPKLMNGEIEVPIEE